MTGLAWSDEENDACVARYFAMLADDIAGAAYTKSEHNRALQKRIGRSRGSIEYKFQNISAVLKGLGEAWIAGYKPAFNFQTSLIDAVARYLASNADWSRTPIRPTQTDMDEAGTLWFGAAPTLSNAPPPDELEQMNIVAQRFDVARRDARNRALGRAGEERVFLHERARLRGAGRDDLAQRVCWTSRDKGDGAGFDIASFEADGRERLIEVKTTNGWERTPFHISRNELKIAGDRADVWRLVRVWNFARTAQAFELHPPLERHVSLMPTSFQADFH